MGTKLTNSPVSFKTADAGVTLVELLVVVAVLAVLGAGSSVLAYRSSGRDAAQSDLAWFRESFDRARLLAIQGRSARGLNVTPSGLQQLSFRNEDWEKGASVRPWQGRVVLAARSPLRNDTPDIVFLANGQTTGFSIQFSNGASLSQRCETDGWADLQCSGG